MRSLMKGGIWKNTEDEILKACVMKYGPNQWSRISSLIVRKSAKECKARWYEWLDPRIKKTEWTREEEEKLLYLAKIFPAQWRTIAPRIGRTPTQCIEHYERLLDQAQGKSEMDENDPRKLRPGEIDPNPETKPAKPDAIHMDEDEKEMLQEARARLANTKEKQLSHAKRLSELQKKRELKVAGIEIDIRREIKGVDYNQGVPFERKVQTGRYEIEDELLPPPTNAEIGTYVEKRRDEEEKKRKELDKDKMKKMKIKNLPKAVDIVSKMNDANTLAFKTKLNLPAAQISDQEIDTISKMNKEKANALSSSNNDSTKALLGEMSQREQTPMAMRTPMVQNSLMSEAKRTHDIMNAETPLVGGEGPQAGVGLITQSLKNTISQTPNAYVVQSMQRPDSILRPKDTATRMLPPGAITPARPGAAKPDGETYEADSAWESNSLAPSLTAKEQKYQELMEEKRNKLDLLNSFKSMPKPKNQYQMEVDDIEELDDSELVQKQEQQIEDRELTKKRLEEEAFKREVEQFKRQSQVIQMGLPRPSIINFEEFKATSKPSQAERLINDEMSRILIHDNSKFPLEQTKPVNRVLKDYPEYSLRELERANQLIQDEMAQQEDYSNQDEVISNYEDRISSLLSMKYTPSLKSINELATLSPAQQKETLETDEKFVKKQLQKELKKVKKAEDELKNKYTSLTSSQKERSEKIHSLYKEIEKKARQLEVFKTIQTLESKIQRARVEEQNKYLRQQLAKEKDLQNEYYRLTHK
ncbi:unnamed protein product [Moneuplotes crassus]|uniref:Cell division cycle 5-like protein n=2 Tax=Euplotes crassus TaxID=5936 RepID=A0AAD1Y9D1_EUPCR|nr:unnamed protein product [Moneuplotes crassus]